MMARPPRIPTALLTVLLARAHHDEVLGDLAEEFAARRARGRNPWPAAFWYWRQAALIGCRIGSDRAGRALSALWAVAREVTTGDRERLWRGVVADVRFGLRNLGRHPGATAVAVVAIALGIGLNTAIAGLARTVFLAPTPYPHAGRLGLIGSAFAGINQGGFSTSVPDMEDVGADTPGVDALALFLDWQSVNLVGGDQPRRVAVNFVTANYFTMLGFDASIGRLIDEDETRAGQQAPVAVLSHALWQEAFGGSREVIGQSIVLNDAPFTVIGVLEPGTYDLSWRYRDRPQTGIYLPLLSATPLTGLALDGNRSGRYVSGLVRWSDQSSLETLQRSLDLMSARLADAYPASNRGWSFRLEPLRSVLFQDTRASTLLLFAGSVVVLLLVCANLTNLLLMQFAGRAPELSVRLALGAGRRRLVRQLVTESVTLSAIGGAFGIALAFWASGVLGRAQAFSLPGFARPAVDAPVLAVSVAVVIVVGVLIGFGPAMRASRADRSVLIDGVRHTGYAASRARSVLAVAEVALACVLLVCAGLLVQSFRTMRGTGLGFDTSRLVSIRLDLRSDRYGDDVVVRQTADRLIEGLSTIPGLDDAFLWSPSPIGGGNWVSFLTRPGEFDVDPAARVEASRHHVRPGALGQLGIRLVSGRDFVETDGPDAPRVAIVSEALARTIWGDAPAVGRRLEGRYRAEREIVEVVGVAADVRHRSRLQDPFGPQRDIYFPFDQRPERFLSLLLRPRPGIGDAPVAAAARGLVQRLDPTLPLYDVSTLEDRMRQEEAQAQLATLLMALYAALALSLAVLGVYGVLAYAVRLQQREIGIRLALGARLTDVVGSVVGRGLRLALLGAGIGAVVALAASRLMSGLLFGVDPHDPVIFAVAPLVLPAVALLACALPARRAARVDPVDALRQP